MTFFFDNNLSARLAEILRILGVDVIHLRDRFPQDVKDVDWIPIVGSEGLIVVTADDRLRRNVAERAAIRQYTVSVIYLPKNYLDRGLWEQAEFMVRHWRKIESQLDRLSPGFQVRSTDNGKLETLS